MYVSVSLKIKYEVYLTFACLLLFPFSRLLRGSKAQSGMTKFEAIIFALSMTPFPHEVWSPAFA